MIGSEEIERAEKVLQVVYGQQLDRQMENLQVDLDALFACLEFNKDVVKSRYPDAWAEMDPRMEPALNTLLMHMFCVGLITGRNSERMIV